VIPEDVLATLPTAPQNRETAIPFNSKWWADNLDEVTRRFDLFIQE
jgi:putative spermidine/putrescine transport system substrate-binding protein